MLKLFSAVWQQLVDVAVEVAEKALEHDAHMAINHFVDHLPYFRQHGINVRLGVHTSLSTLAQWAVLGVNYLERSH